jgi:predicted transglutaminase-like cysteine proteinase
MKLINFLKPLVCKEEDAKIFELTSHCFLKDTEIERLTKTLDVASRQYNNLLADNSKDALFWDNKWAKNNVTYKAQGFKADIRNLIFTKSHILFDKAEELRLKSKTNDELALNTLKFVKSHLKYSGDANTHKATEFWQSPDETFQTKTGDCEDGALLIISLLRIAGMPAYRVKLCAGWVNLGIYADEPTGHAYIIYLANDGKWYSLDWCYYGDQSINKFLKVQHKDNEAYGEIWWTANDKYTWAQKSIDVDKLLSKTT